MTLKDFSNRVKDARAVVAHYALGIAIAERRIAHFKRRYAVAARGGHDALKARAQRRLRFWRIHKSRLEQVQKNWKGIVRRRVKQKVRYLKAHPPVAKTNAVFDGIDVAPWMVGQAPGPDGRTVNWLQLIRDHGWSGTVVSGVRSVQHSIELCYQICGAASCPGRCAGATSNHNCGDPCASPAGAIDVTDYSRFGAIAREVGAPLQNQLPVDPVHFSYTGH
jgi:hypothetical protein